MRYIILIFVMLTQGCVFQTSLDKYNSSDPKRHELDEFVRTIQQGALREDYRNFSKITKFPVEIRGSMDYQRRYLHIGDSENLFAELMKENSGYNQEFYDNRSRLLDLTSTYDASAWLASGSSLIGPLLVSHKDGVWKIVAIYSDREFNRPTQSAEVQ
jgi:hypothetical protein